ncbi:MAG: Ig-like domain-containing protein [Eubacteriales bacterium]|nr:Ig-like domain-containing protein [Eubacteriales bacterium]
MKKNLQKTGKLLLSFLTILLLFAAVPSAEVQAAPKLSAKSVTLFPGQTKTLKVTGTSKKITWTSSKKSVATVNSKGKITAKKKGTATITAKFGSQKLTCKVTVKKASSSAAGTKPVTKIKLNTNRLTLNKGAETQLKATVSPSNASNKKVTWTSSNKNVATVSSSGIVTAVKKGTATITAKAADGSGKKVTCKVTVTEDFVSNVVGVMHTLIPGEEKVSACVGVQITNNTSENISVQMSAWCTNLDQMIFRSPEYVIARNTTLLYAEGYAQKDAFAQLDANDLTVTIKPGKSRILFFETVLNSRYYWDFTPNTEFVIDIYNSKNEAYTYKLDVASSIYLEYTGYHSSYQYRNASGTPDHTTPPSSSGTTEKIKQKCIFCHGTGKCTCCNGTGRLEHVQSLIIGNKCRACSSGKCCFCKGKGYTYV